MEFFVLGCASAYPSPTRPASAYVLRLPEGECWLFDCGEGTQIELMRSEVRAGRIRRIFITHLHGDHLFGLPGLICTVGQLGGESQADRPALEIYGPRGLRRYLRESLRLSRSILPWKYRVHELHFDPFVWRTTEPFAGDKGQLPPVEWSAELETSSESPPHPNELTAGASDIWPDPDGCWKLLPGPDDDAGGQALKYRVHAAWLPHTAPSFAFLIVEEDRPGKLDAQRALQLGVPKGRALGLLKAGESVEATDPATGAPRIVKPCEVVGPPVRGRRLAVLGDTSDSTAALQTLCPASPPLRLDLLVHESTLDGSMSASATAKGHSTPVQAAVAARDTQSEKLLLTHFSQRYHDVDLEGLAREAKNHYSGELFVARPALKIRI